MACGCCVVGSRVGGTPELIGEDQRGLLFESENVEDLSEKLAKLMSDGVLRQTLGLRAAEFARTELSMEANVLRATEIYTKLLNEHHVPH